ncbi:MAG: DUF4835 family protein [Chitinophagales bacterium]|nr:DUF4835 family protein [Chitinophagales bacterium]MDW8419756.1 DUF4835 family protein [Chitinophagales bacterium]
MSRLENMFVKSALTLLVLLTGLLDVSAQELKCNVTVNGQRINGVDPSVFTTMQSQIMEFMNSRAWTTDQFGPEERIECSFFINLTQSPSQDVYKASVTIQSSRPVFNTNYNSPMLNYIDNEWTFTYVQNQPLEFNVTQYNNNLTSLLGFYAYIIIGLDYESMAKGGGTKWFNMAEQIMNNIPTNSPEAYGWRPPDGQVNRNRYWLINNLQASKYEAFKQAIYEYHFMGLDNMYEKPALARQNILNSLNHIEKISKDNPNGILLAVFFQAKADELINIFSGAEMDIKTKAVSILRRIDPSNASRYDKIIRS